MKGSMPDIWHCPRCGIGMRVVEKHIQRGEISRCVTAGCGVRFRHGVMRLNGPAVCWIERDDIPLTEVKGEG